MANIDDTIGLPNSHPAIEYRQTQGLEKADKPDLAPRRCLAQ